MAWDALQGRFEKKKTPGEEDKSLWGERSSLGGSTVGGTASPQAQPLGGFGGTAGSAGSNTANFVNYSTLYGLNEEKAKSMANNVYRGAEKKADDAKGKLADAESQFNQASQFGTSKGTIGGKHGTRIRGPEAQTEDGTSVKYQGTGKWVDKPGVHGGLYTSSTSRDINRAGQEYVPDNSGWTKDGMTGESTRGLQRTGAGATNAGRYRYASLYGEPVDVGLAWNPDKADSAGDYHHSVSYGEANTGKGGEYTGPDSLKGQMGDEAYNALSEEFRKANESLGNTADAGGLAAELGYTGGIEGNGNAALDAGLTQTAGQSNFKKLRERYAGLGKLLPDAQTNSIATAGRGEADSQRAAAEWDSLMSEFDAQQGKAKPGAVVLNAAQSEGSGGAQLGPLGGTSSTANSLSKYGFSMQDYNDALFTDEEKVLLAREDAGILDDLASGVTEIAGISDEDFRVWQAILMKLRAAKAKRQGGA